MYRFAFVLALVLIVTGAAWAQTPQQPTTPSAASGAMMQGQPGMMQCPMMGQGTGMGQAPMMNMGAMCSMMGMPCCQMPIVISDTNSIYILRGNQLLKYDKYSLKLEKSATLPDPEPVKAGLSVPCCSTPQAPDTSKQASPAK